MESAGGGVMRALPDEERFFGTLESARKWLREHPQRKQYRATIYETRVAIVEQHEPDEASHG
jgi:hypothetical protein